MNEKIISQTGNLTTVNLVFTDQPTAYFALQDETGSVISTINKICEILKTNLNLSQPIQYEYTEKDDQPSVQKKVLSAIIKPETMWETEADWGVNTPILYIELTFDDNTTKTIEIDYMHFSFVIKAGQIVVTSSMQIGGQLVTHLLKNLI